VSIAVVRFDRQINVPIGALDSKTHFQGAGWAKSPVDGREWFFQMQATPTGVGDVEDLYVHRYSLAGDALTYRDTMVGVGFGHCQTVNVRISAANNAQLWLGLKSYDAAHATVGERPHKVRYRAGRMERADRYVVPIYVPGNWAAPIDSPDWTITLRRPSGDTEVYEWYSEDELAQATPAKPAKPRSTLRVPKVDTYQSACALGTYEAPEGVYRLNGAATDTPQWLTQFRVDGSPTVQLETTNIVKGSGGGTLEEPEAVLTVRNEQWVGKQTSPYTKDRIVAYLPVAKVSAL